MGIGITGTRRLMDQFDIETSAQGTVVTLKKFLPRSAAPLSPAQIEKLAEELTRRRPTDGPFDELKHRSRNCWKCWASCGGGRKSSRF